MSDVTAFISELVRAANEVDKLGAYEKRRLLDRSVVIIREMRRTIGIPPSGTARDAVIDLQTLSARIDKGTVAGDHVRNALLDAAAMLRDLHIIIDTKVDIALNFVPKGSGEA